MSFVFPISYIGQAICIRDLLWVQERPPLKEKKILKIDPMNSVTQSQKRHLAT